MRSQFCEQLQKYLHSPQQRRFEFGSQVFQIQRCILTKEEDLLMVEDVTRIQQLEQTINKEEQLAIIGRMSASLAHEIRNPIASLSGAVQLLAEQRKVDFTLIILREVNRINELVDLFLQSARSQHLTLEHTSVVPSILEIVEALQHDPRAQSVTMFLKSCQMRRSILMWRSFARSYGIYFSMLGSSEPKWSSCTQYPRLTMICIQLKSQTTGRVSHPKI